MACYNKHVYEIRIGKGGGHSWVYRSVVGFSRYFIFQKCAYTQKCIVPRNSSGENHRHDQSILTLLINDFSIPYSASQKYYYTPATHTDGLGREGTERALRNVLFKIKNTYSVAFTNSFYNITDWKQTGEEFTEASRPVDSDWK